MQNKILPHIKNIVLTTCVRERTKERSRENGFQVKVGIPARVADHKSRGLIQNGCLMGVATEDKAPPATPDQ